MRRLSIISLVLVAVSCNDTIQPVINLEGSTDFEVSLNTEYVDPGATAKDNKNGDISALIVVTGTEVNTNQTGTYPRYYDVEDESGNRATRVVRNVTVVNDADFLIGTYTATSNCGATNTNDYNAEVTASENINNSISINILLVGSLGYFINGSLDNDSVKFPLQNLGNSAITVQGEGPITSAGFNTHALTSDQNLDCQVVHTKQ